MEEIDRMEETGLQGGKNIKCGLAGQEGEEKEEWRKIRGKEKEGINNFRQDAVRISKFLHMTSCRSKINTSHLINSQRQKKAFRPVSHA